MKLGEKKKGGVCSGHTTLEAIYRSSGGLTRQCADYLGLFR